MFIRLLERLQQAEPGDVSNGGGAAAQTPSLEDTIGAAFDAIEARGESADAGADTEAQPDAAADDAGEVGEKASRSRDATGKFAKAGAESGKTAADTAGASALETPAADTALTEAAVTSKFVEPPRSWNAAEKASWDKVPEEARAAMHRREQDFFKGIEQYRGHAANFQALHEVIAPHADVIKQSGQNAVENIGGLLNMQRALLTGDESIKLGTLLEIARNSGVNSESLVAALQNPQSAPAQDPRYDALARRLDEQQRILEQQRRAPIESQVQAFLADPKNEFASDPAIAERMEKEISSGLATTLQEAYDNACALSKTVQATLKQRQAQADAKAAEAKQKEEAKRKADLAAKAQKAASMNVRPHGVTIGQPAKKGTLEETIGATWDAIAARK